MNYETIIRIPYTTLPNFEKYEGALLHAPPAHGHLAAKKAMFEDDLKLGQSWFETENALRRDLVRKTAMRLGFTHDIGSLRNLALLVQEDVAILHEGRLEACCFMFPSGWAPETKRGMDFAELHAPVADGDRLRAAGPRITALMCGEDCYHRYVWGLAASGRLSAHPRYRGETTAPKSPADVWFRYEHQITVPVEAGVTSAFLVDVQMGPYPQLPDAVRDRVLQSIATMSPAVARYKELAPFKAILFG